MAKDESPRKPTPGGTPPLGDDSLDFTDIGPSKTPVQPRRKKPRTTEVVKKAPGSRSVGVPVLIALAAVIVVVFIMAEQSSKEVVTKAPPGKPSQKGPKASKPPQTAPASKAPAPPTPAYTPPPQTSAPPGAHRRAVPPEFRKALLEYASKTGGKAIALAHDGDGKWAFGSVSGFATDAEASKEALSDCATYRKQAGVQENCKLYAVGDTIVW